MRTKRKDGQETRANLLNAAAKVFAEKGFRAATVVEICQAAGANVASVNYYFRGKEELYVHAWRRSFEESLRKYPVDGGVPADAPIEERLRGHIRATVARCADPESVDFDITHQEMTSPTGLLKDIMRESIRPLRELTTRLVQEFMGANASEVQVELGHMSVISQCISPFIRDRGRRRLGICKEEARGEILEIDPEEIADHVFEFSLAGLRHMMANSRGREGHE